MIVANFVVIETSKNMNTEERVELAKAYFRQGYNCSQSVVLAFQDICGVDSESLKKLCAGLGGGVGRMREVCGCVCGMAVLSGFIESQTLTPNEQKKAAYTLTQKMASDFKKETGSIVCRELLGLSSDHVSPLSTAPSPTPEPRTDDYYKKRPCEQMVALAARIVSEALKNSNNF